MAMDDVTQLVIQGNVSGENHIHTIHARHRVGNATDQMLIDQWQAGCRSQYRLLFSITDSPCILYTARQVCGALPLRAPVEEGEVSPNILGSTTKSGNVAPSWLAQVFSLRTALAGRSRRGRSFIGGLWETEINGNDIAGDRVNYGAGYKDALLATFGATGTSLDFQLAVWSQTLRDLPGSTCLGSATAVSAILQRTLIGSMKSRKPGSGT